MYAASIMISGNFEIHQTQKERPLLVAWQRPLLRTAEHLGDGDGIGLGSGERRMTPPLAGSQCDPWSLRRLR